MSHRSSEIEARDKDQSRPYMDFTGDLVSLPSEALGVLDELSCWIGVLIATTSASRLRKLLLLAQHDLVDLMVQVKLAGSPLLSPKHLSRIEDGMQGLKMQIDPPVDLTLPGGLPTAAFAHIARSVCRRAERRLCSLTELASAAEAMLSHPPQGHAARDRSGIAYLERLSQLLLLISRIENNDGRADVTWDREMCADPESGD